MKGKRIAVNRQKIGPEYKNHIVIFLKARMTHYPFEEPSCSLVNQFRKHNLLPLKIHSTCFHLKGAKFCRKENSFSLRGLSWAERPQMFLLRSWTPSHSRRRDSPGSLWHVAGSPGSPSKQWACSADPGCNLGAAHRLIHFSAGSWGCAQM